MTIQTKETMQKRKRQIIGVYKKSTVCDILQSVLLDN